MKQYQHYPVSREHEGMTVEGYLKNVLNVSGRRIQKLTRLKGILLNGKVVFLQRKIKFGDVVNVRVLEDISYGVLPEQGKVDILYEDSHLIILNKPANMLVHPTGRTFHSTLANFLAYYFMKRGEVVTIRPLHRLDRDTSGCVVFAKDVKTQTLLEEQLHDGRMKRIYLAMVEGQVEPPDGIINAAIGPHPTQENRRTIDPKGEPAITHYRTLGSFGKVTLLEVSLETGRTHQIRVHLSHTGYPIVGDRMYGKRSPLIPRQALHAESVHLIHPIQGRPILARAPIPLDLEYLIQLWKSGNELSTLKTT